MTRPYYPATHTFRDKPSAQGAMLRLAGGAALAGAVALALFASDGAHAQAGAPIAQFDGGIGVVPATWAGATNATPTGGAAAANNVNDTPPAGRPWVIADLKAQVSGDGSFVIRGKGLVFAGGGSVGRGVAPNGGPISVRARLYCGPNGSGGKFTSDETVQLAPNGDFRLRGQFPVVNQPLDCPLATLLVLNAGQSAANAGGWFAAGIPK